MLASMNQLRRISLTVAVIGMVFAVVSGAILFFVIEPPFLASIFMASSWIAIGCFLLAAIGGFFGNQAR